MQCFVFPFRLKNQKTAVVTTVDKKIPNGILEEQGNVVELYVKRCCRQIVGSGIRWLLKDAKINLSYLDFELRRKTVKADRGREVIRFYISAYT